MAVRERPGLGRHDRSSELQEQVIGACPGYEEVFLPDLYQSDYYLYPPKIPTSDSYGSIMGSEWEKRLGQKRRKRLTSCRSRRRKNSTTGFRSPVDVCMSV